MSLETAEQIRVAARKIAPDVVQMTSVHPVSDPRIFHKISCSLAQSGLAVTLVVPHDKDERINGVDVCGVPASKPESAVYRCLNFTPPLTYGSIQLFVTVSQILEFVKYEESLIVGIARAMM